MPFRLRGTSVRPSLDVMGATASMVCAVHCAAVAIFLGVLPAAASFLTKPWIDWAFLFASVVIGAFALLPGYKRHKDRAPLLLFASGIAMLAALRIMRAQPSLGEMIVVITAATCLVTAHWRNRGALSRCSCAPAAPQG